MQRFGCERRAEDVSNAMRVRSSFASSTGRADEECPSWEGMVREKIPPAQVLGFSEGTSRVREEAKRQSAELASLTPSEWLTVTLLRALSPCGLS